MHLRKLACGAATAVLLLACTPGKVSGLYSNAENTASIEFLPEGKAHISLSGMGGDCSYEQHDKTVALTCEGESTTLTVGDDGALAGPPDGFWTRLTKK